MPMIPRRLPTRDKRPAQPSKPTFGSDVGGSLPRHQFEKMPPASSSQRRGAQAHRQNAGASFASHQILALCSRLAALIWGPHTLSSIPQYLIRLDHPTVENRAAVFTLAGLQIAVCVFNPIILLSPGPARLRIDSIIRRSRRWGDHRNPTFVDEGTPTCALGPQEAGEII